MSTCRGLDVSQYQSAQDWAAHQANGVVFAMAKASEGLHSRDNSFAAHITGIKNHGLVPGAYHFAWPNEDVTQNAANYIDAVKPYAGHGFTHWLDLERYSDGRNYSGQTSKQILAWASHWITAVVGAFPGQRVGVYSSAADIASGHVPAGVPLWYPAYPGTSVDTWAEAEKRARPAPSGRTPMFWQFTSTPGGTGRLDLDLCFMSAVDLRTWAGLSAPAPAKAHVSLTHVIAAARKDPNAAQGHTTYKADVLVVENALHAEGLLDHQYIDGSFGTKTIAAYARWQHSPAGGGYTGSAADGIPGAASLRRLAARHGFTVNP